MTLHFYKEADGDYLCVDPGTREYYAQRGEDCLEGRATAITGLLGSVATTAIGLGYLQDCCKLVKKADVPRRWRRVLIGE